MHFCKIFRISFSAIKNPVHFRSDPVKLFYLLKAKMKNLIFPNPVEHVLFFLSWFCSIMPANGQVVVSNNVQIGPMAILDHGRQPGIFGSNHWLRFLMFPLNQEDCPIFKNLWGSTPYEGNLILILSLQKENGDKI